MRLRLAAAATLTLASFAALVASFHVGMPGRGSWLAVAGIALWFAALRVALSAVGDGYHVELVAAEPVAAEPEHRVIYLQDWFVAAKPEHRVIDLRD